MLNVKIVRWLGVERAIFLSIFIKACSVLGFALMPSFIWILIFSIPLGLAAGTVDPTLNNYLALNYKPRYISWLHCLWSGGSVLGPFADRILYF